MSGRLEKRLEQQRLEAESKHQQVDEILCQSVGDRDSLDVGDVFYRLHF